MWKDFHLHDNYFMRIIEREYTVIINSVPDLLIYSCFGKEHKKFNCHKLFYSGESVQPLINDYDFSISHEISKRASHYHLPYGAFRLFELNAIEELTRLKTDEEVEGIIGLKEGICSIVVSNGLQEVRNNFLSYLQEHMFVASGGKYKNNIGASIANKSLFISKYVFNICFENSSQEGYLTEKIVDAFLANCIPIYWGDPRVINFFNPSKFIYFDGSNYQECLQKMIMIYEDKKLLFDILKAPVFTGNIPNHIFDQKAFFNFIHLCCQESFTNGKGDRFLFKRYLRLLPGIVSRKLKTTLVLMKKYLKR